MTPAAAGFPHPPDARLAAPAPVAGSATRSTTARASTVVVVRMRMVCSMDRHRQGNVKEGWRDVGNLRLDTGKG